MVRIKVLDKYDRHKTVHIHTHTIEVLHLLGRRKKIQVNLLRYNRLIKFIWENKKNRKLQWLKLISL